MAFSEGFKNAVRNGSILNTELTIKVFGSDGTVIQTITNRFITSESMKLTQAICDDSELRFGGCVSSAFEIDISSQFDITGRYITVDCAQTAVMPLYPSTLVYPGATIYPGGAVYTETLHLFSGDVFSCKLEKNRLTRHLIAYDQLYRKGEMSCKALYDGLFSGGTATLGQLRAAIISSFGFTEVQSVTLPADGFIIHKMDVDELTVNDALRMIGEFNGVFIRLNGHGDIEYISIGSSASGAAEEYTYYIDATAEDYSVTGYDCIETHTAPNVGVYDMFADSPQDKPYSLDNELVLAGYADGAHTGDSFSDAWNGVRAALEPNFTVAYTPFELKAQARLWVQPGDKVSFVIKWYSLHVENDAETTVTHTRTITTTVLSRRLTGIQAMTEELVNE